MKLVEISPIEFRELVSSEPNKSFYQTLNWGNFYNNLNYSPIYIGYKDDNNVYSALGLFLIAEKESLFSSRKAICPYGFLINYFDNKLLSDFTSDLKKYLSKKGVGQLVINPNVTYLTSRGNNDLLIKNLTKLGYIKTSNNSYYTVKIDKIEKSNSIDDIYFQTYKVDKDDKAQKLFKTNINYKYLYDSMSDMAKFIVCEIDINKSIDKLNESIIDAKHFIEIHIDDYKYDEKREDKAKSIEEKENYIRLLNKCKKELGGTPLLAVTCLIEFNNKITRLFTDDKKDYSAFNALDVLNEKTLQTISELGYDAYDCYTANDSYQKTELIGEFTYRIK